MQGVAAAAAPAAVAASRHTLDRGCTIGTFRSEASSILPVNSPDHPRRNAPANPAAAGGPSGAASSLDELQGHPRHWLRRWVAKVVAAFLDSEKPAWLPSPLQRSGRIMHTLILPCAAPAAEAGISGRRFFTASAARAAFFDPASPFAPRTTPANTIIRIVPQQTGVCVGGGGNGESSERYLSDAAPQVTGKTGFHRRLPPVLQLSSSSALASIARPCPRACISSSPW